MKKKVLILGKRGALASQLILTFKKNNYKNFKIIDRKKNNIIKNFNNLKIIIKKYQPTHIVNCLALTGIDDCEKNVLESYEVNAFFPFKLAELIKNKKIKLIHFSTDAIFDGYKKNKIYSEKDKPNPQSIYGKSKYLADLLIAPYKNTLIIRLPLLFGPTNRKQIIGKLKSRLLANKKVFASSDIFSTPVYTPNLAEFILKMIIIKNKFNTKRIIHYTSDKYLSIFELIKKISKNIKKDHLVFKVKDSFFKSNVQKPKNLGLRTMLKYNKNQLDLKFN